MKLKDPENFGEYIKIILAIAGIGILLSLL